jgi:hypothetical protein
MSITVAPGLQGRTVSRPSLTASTIDAMFALLSTHFTGADRATFEVDLAEKNLVILLEDDDGVLRGFSTLVTYDTTAAGESVRVVYSGDTIVDRAWWGSSALARTWIQTVQSLRPQDGRELYWLLLTSGFRTYRFLPVFFREFYPCCDAAEAVRRADRTEVRQLADAIARERFGSRYDADTGIVRFDRPYVLAGDLLDVPDGKTADPHVRYFLERNPGFVAGDELVCLTRIDADNLTPAGRRMARRCVVEAGSLVMEAGSLDPA